MTTALATFTAVSILAIGTYLNQTSYVSAANEEATSRSTTRAPETTTITTTKAESHVYEWKEVYGKRYLKIDKKILRVGQMSKGRNISLGLMEQQQQDF